MKGIVLAAGSGTRLYPITRGINKHLLPLYDKPMIYYPLSVLMLAGIQEILIITTPEDHTSFTRLLGDGSDFGVKFSYQTQQKPEGIAQAFIIAKNFIADDSVCLILGDNVFFGQGFSPLLSKAKQKMSGATVFAYPVKEPQHFGVIEFDRQNQIKSIEEKPTNPKSNCAVTGLYFYDNQVVNIAESLKPSERGELEITDINRIYLKQRELNVEVLGRGFAWLDTGTHESLMDAGQFVQTIEQRQGLKVACLEEISWRNGWLTSKHLLSLAEPLKRNSYGQYLESLVIDTEVVTQQAFVNRINFNKVIGA